MKHIQHSTVNLGIMAVSDIYQALTEERPYRNPMGKKEAFSILQKMVQEKRPNSYSHALYIA
ncbi:MAG: hypothetical protein GX244_07085 [Firmicutes bacterium]|jgi:hypothetical protein|nr:hypothetical protein [Bacillota bacterium]